MRSGLFLDARNQWFSENNRTERTGMSAQQAFLASKTTRTFRFSRLKACLKTRLTSGQWKTSYSNRYAANTRIPAEIHIIGGRRSPKAAWHCDQNMYYTCRSRRGQSTRPGQSAAQISIRAAVRFTKAARLALPYAPHRPVLQAADTFDLAYTFM